MEIAGIYDNGPISPICKIKDNLAIKSGGKWFYHRVEHIEGMLRSSALTINMGAVAAGATLPKAAVLPMQIAENDFFHMRFEPIDDVEGVLWEVAATLRFNAQNVLARASRFTCIRDPWLVSTTFWVLGGINRNMNLEVRNPSAVYPSLTSFFAFWGWRYILTPLTFEYKSNPGDESKMSLGEPDTVKKYLPYVTWVPAEGMNV